MSQQNRASATAIRYESIGVIRSLFRTIEGMPIQPSGARGVVGTIEIDPRYEAGLADLDGFSHVILIYHFHRAKGCALKVRPFLDQQERGLFATRAPRRPNPIGLSVVELLRVEGCTVKVKGCDILDGTPLLDIKPFVPEFDAPQVERLGWLSGRDHRAAEMRSDDRFQGS